MESPLCGLGWASGIAPPSISWPHVAKVSRPVPLSADTLSPHGGDSGHHQELRFISCGFHHHFNPPPLARLGSGSPLDQAVEAECEASFRRESHHRRRAVVWADQRAGVPTPGFNLFVLKQGLAKCSPHANLADCLFV